jgi:hypothetical protein
MRRDVLLNMFVVAVMHLLYALFEICIKGMANFFKPFHMTIEPTSTILIIPLSNLNFLNNETQRFSFHIDPTQAFPVSDWPIFKTKTYSETTLL